MAAGWGADGRRDESGRDGFKGGGRVVVSVSMRASGSSLTLAGTGVDGRGRAWTGVGGGVNEGVFCGRAQMARDCLSAALRPRAVGKSEGEGQGLEHRHGEWGGRQ